jgi:hypothetical protein
MPELVLLVPAYKVVAHAARTHTPGKFACKNARREKVCAKLTMLTVLTMLTDLK